MAVIAILDCNFPSTEIEESVIARAGAEYRKAQCATEEQVVDVAADVDAIIVQYAPLTERVMDHLRRCRSISRYGIGVDNVDVPAATARGIWVTNVPGFCAHEVAEHTMALVLAFARHLKQLDRSVHAGRWDTIAVMRPARRLSALTLGLVGFGQVAREVASSARGFGMRVVATAPHTTAETMAGVGVMKVGLDTLLAESDFVSLHLPVTAETRHLIDAHRFREMKPGACLLNTSRGALVDEGALIDALQSGRIAGAGLDVLETEPPAPDNPLLAMDNVIITPHAAFYSDDSLAYLQTAVAEEAVRVVQGEAPRYPVNPAVLPRVV